MFFLKRNRPASNTVCNYCSNYQFSLGVVPCLFIIIKEFVHAEHAYIELWMHAGSLESTKDA